MRPEESQLRPSAADGYRVIHAVSEHMCMRSSTSRTWTRIWRKLTGAWRNPYRPEQHYMRGPGPKWRAKHSRSRP
jgi:hypothetical protein